MAPLAAALVGESSAAWVPEYREWLRDRLTKDPQVLVGGPRAGTDDIHGVDVLGSGVGQTEPAQAKAIRGI